MSLGDNEASRFAARPDELYVFEVEGRQTYHYTPARLPVMVGAFSYTPKVIQRGNYTFKKDMTSEDSLKIDVQNDLDFLENFKVIVPVRTTNVTIFRRHRGDPDGELRAIFRGRVRGVTWGNAKATVECDSMTAMAKRGGLTLNYQIPCNHFLYTVGCGLAKGDWGKAGRLTQMSSNNRVLESPVFGSKPDGWWKLGFIEIGEGAYMVTAHSGNSVTLLNGVEGVAVNSDFIIYPGCDLKLDTCWDKFNNGLNHLGFKWSPAENVFETGI